MTAALGVAAFDPRRVENPEAKKLATYPLFGWLRFILAAAVVLAHEGVALPGPIDGGLAAGLAGGIAIRAHGG